MEELSKLVKKKYKDFDITSRQLGNILRDNNKTRKRTRHEHFPKIRYGTPVNKQNELNKFYKEIDKYPLNKLISLDETSIQPAMIMEYSRSELGKDVLLKQMIVIYFVNLLYWLLFLILNVLDGHYMKKEE